MKIKNIFSVFLFSFLAICFLYTNSVEAYFEREITAPRAGESIVPGEQFTIAGYQEVGLTKHSHQQFERCAIAYALSAYTMADMPHDPANVRERSYQHFFGYQEGAFSKEENTDPVTNGYYPYMMRCEGRESFQMPNMRDLPADIQAAISDGDPLYVFFYPIYYNDEDGQAQGVNQGTMYQKIYIGIEGNDLPVAFITNPKKDGRDFSEGVVEIEREVGDSIMLSGRGEDADGTIEAYEWRESRGGDVVSYRKNFVVGDWPRVQEYGLTVVDDDGAKSGNFPIVRIRFIEKELFVCPAQDISLGVEGSSSLKSYYSDVGACGNCSTIRRFLRFIPDCNEVTDISRWLSTDDSIASVSGGLVQGLNEGDAKISAQYSGVSSNEVRVNVITSNTAPSSPDIFGPTTREINQSGTYTFSGSVDSENDNIQYQIDWDASGSIDQSLSWCSGDGSCSLNASQSWPTQGNKTFQARACDTSSACSGWTSYSVNVITPADCEWKWTGYLCDSPNRFEPPIECTAERAGESTTSPGCSVGVCECVPVQINPPPSDSPLTIKQDDCSGSIETIVLRETHQEQQIVACDEDDRQVDVNWTLYGSNSSDFSLSDTSGETTEVSIKTPLPTSDKVTTVQASQIGYEDTQRTVGFDGEPPSPPSQKIEVEGARWKEVAP